MIEWLHNAMHPFDLDGLLTLAYGFVALIGWRSYRAKGSRKQ